MGIVLSIEEMLLSKQKKTKRSKHNQGNIQKGKHSLQLAEKLLRNADKLSTNWLISINKRNSKIVELNENAGDIYVFFKKTREAANCYHNAANYSNTSGNKSDAARFYELSANQYKIVKDPRYEKFLLAAAKIFHDLKKNKRAGDLCVKLADFNKEEIKDVKRAIDYCNYAINFYDEQSNESFLCKQKVAVLYTQLEKAENDKAADIFEDIACNMLKSKVGRLEAKNFFFKSLLCTIASNQFEESVDKFTEYGTIDSRFDESRECKFIEAILDAIANENHVKFIEAYKIYDDVSPMDNWQKLLIRQMQRNIGVPPLPPPRKKRVGRPIKVPDNYEDQPYKPTYQGTAHPQGTRYNKYGYPIGGYQQQQTQHTKHQHHVTHKGFHHITHKGNQRYGKKQNKIRDNRILDEYDDPDRHPKVTHHHGHGMAHYKHGTTQHHHKYGVSTYGHGGQPIVRPRYNHIYNPHHIDDIDDYAARMFG